MPQKAHHSLLETIGSNVLSALIDIIFVIIIVPILGIKVSLPQFSLAFLLLYLVHMLKSYMWRRFCDKYTVRRKNVKRTKRTK